LDINEDAEEGKRNKINEPETEDGKENKEV
jgi:hypothetical protein